MGRSNLPRAIVVACLVVGSIWLRWAAFRTANMCMTVAHASQSLAEADQQSVLRAVCVACNRVGLELDLGSLLLAALGVVVGVVLFREGVDPAWQKIVPLAGACLAMTGVVLSYLVLT